MHSCELGTLENAVGKGLKDALQSSVIEACYCTLEQNTKNRIKPKVVREALKPGVQTKLGCSPF